MDSKETNVDIDLTPVEIRTHTVDMRIVFDSQLPEQLTALIGPDSPVQQFIDHEILRTIEQYVPKLTGTLIRSATEHTVIGSGLIKWVTPYARFQYFKNPGPPRPTGEIRGRDWIGRWSNDGNVENIVAAASAKFGFGIGEATTAPTADASTTPPAAPPTT
jgi:hypothetical protein